MTDTVSTLVSSSPGGGGVFGPDVTDTVFSRNNLKLLIRSHECKEEGFEYTHDGMVSYVSCLLPKFLYGETFAFSIPLYGLDWNLDLTRLVQSYPSRLWLGRGRI